MKSTRDLAQSAGVPGEQLDVAHTRQAIADGIAIIAEKIDPVCQSHPVIRAYVFGSQARGEQSASSDVDLFCEIDRSKPFGLFARGALVRELQDALGLYVDLVTSSCLELTDPVLHAEIERDKVLVYDREAQ